MLPGRGGSADCQVAKPVYAMWPFFGFFRVFRARGWNMRHAHSDHRRGRGWCPDASGPRAGGVRRARGGTPALGPRERPAEGAHGVTGLAWGSVYGTRTWLFPLPRTSWSTAPGSRSAPVAYGPSTRPLGTDCSEPRLRNPAPHEATVEGAPARTASILSTSLLVSNGHGTLSACPSGRASSRAVVSAITGTRALCRTLSPMAPTNASRAPASNLGASSRRFVPSSSSSTTP